MKCRPVKWPLKKILGSPLSLDLGVQGPKLFYFVNTQAEKVAHSAVFVFTVVTK